MSIQHETAYYLTYQDQSLFDRGDLSLSGLKNALQNQNPRFSEYFVKFIQANMAPPALKKAKSEGKYTYVNLLTDLRTWRFKSDYLKKLKTENPTAKMYPAPRKLVRKYIVSAHMRLWEKVEAAEAQAYLPERLNAYQMILDLSKDNSAFAQASLLDIIQHVPLKWGPWRALRQLYKDSINQQNWKLFAMILARIDHAMTTDSENRLEPNAQFYANSNNINARDVSRKTLAYLSRKGWRTLRKIALFQPYLYTHIATDVLVAYPIMKNKYDFNASWVYNHIVNHHATYTTGGKNKKEVKVYQAETFYYDENNNYRTQNTAKIGTLHAYPELWTQNPTPILKVFELAKHETVINFAKQLVLKNFDHLVKPTQSDMPRFAKWIELISRRKLNIIDEFILNWFQTICPIPQAEFHLYGLHKILLNCLFSQHQATANYAISYVQAHYQSLISEFSIDQVISYLRHSNSNIKKIAELLLDPVHGAFKLNLSQCTELIEDSSTNALAKKIILSSFNGADFTFEWYENAINHKSKLLNDFALELIKKPEFLPTQGTLIDFYWQLLSSDKPTSAGIQFASTALKEPYRADLGVDQSSIRYDIKADQMKALHAFSPLQIKALFLHPNEKISQMIIDWTRGTLKPTVFDQAFLKIVCDDEIARNDQSYLAGLASLQLKWYEQIELEYRHHQAAREWLSNPRYFSIEDLGYDWYYQYALKGYGQYTYAKFKDHFIKDMPIWGLASASSIESLKGLKGENLKSAKLKVIKEAFEIIVQKFTSNKTHYYEIYLIEELFRTRHYAAFQQNHPDRKQPSIDIGMPAELFTFEIYRKFAFQNHYTVKDIARLILGFDLARWCSEGQITFQTLLDIFSNADEEVRASFLTAMSRTPRSPEERIDLTLAQFKPEDLFQFCLSPKATVRDFALRLIKDYPERYAKPSELARLMDSSDRRVCETAVKILYQHFHQIQGTQPWAPYAESVSPSSSIAKKQITLIKQNPPEDIKAKDLKNKKYLGLGTAEKTQETLVSSEILVDFFKRTVFQIPHTHPLKADLRREDVVVKAWKNKVNLIKVLKDIALEDQAFAKVIAPLFTELLQSRGQSEQHACLTAIVQLRNAYPELQLSF